MKKFKAYYKNRVFSVTAKDAESAVDAVKAVVNEVEDERLSPMTYSKLKEMGYSHNDWKDWTQEQANKVVAEGKTISQNKQPTQSPKQQKEEQVKSTKVNLTPDNGFSDGEFAEFVQSSLGENYNPENLTVKTVVDLWEKWNGDTWEYNGRQYPGYDLSYETKAKLLKQEGEINF